MIKGWEWDLNPIRSRWPLSRRRLELIRSALTRPAVNQRPKLSTKDTDGILVNMVIWKTSTFIERFWSCPGIVYHCKLHTVTLVITEGQFIHQHDQSSSSASVSFSMLSSSSWMSLTNSQTYFGKCTTRWFPDTRLPQKEVSCPQNKAAWCLSVGISCKEKRLLPEKEVEATSHLSPATLYSQKLVHLSNSKVCKLLAPFPCNTSCNTSCMWQKPPDMFWIIIYF